MLPDDTRQLGSTDVRLPALGFGGATLGNAHGAVDEEQAMRTMEAAWDAGLTYFDTAPMYGSGLSEHRLGNLLRQKPRDAFVLSTKVGRVLRRPANPEGHRDPDPLGALPFETHFDYGYDGIMRSYEDSLQRLGLTSVDMLLIHDLESRYLNDEAIVGEQMGALERDGWKALEALRAGGQIRAIGAGVNQRVSMTRFLERFALDFLLIALPYTLLDQASLHEEMALCAERDVGLVIGAPYWYGLLTLDADDPAQRERWAGHPKFERAMAFDAVCRGHGVPLKAAALQFPLGHPSVANVLSGPSSPEQLRDNVAMMTHEIPDALWRELKSEGLLCDDAPTP
ncbi:MAG: pyridoxal 4-dehydrogenase [Phycisphaeraceae bacterium]|nr:pyridoxal 4-dehydrogenase [Phycisphaeraceae bacterium]